jgi:hypothetical protein
MPTINNAAHQQIIQNKYFYQKQLLTATTIFSYKPQQKPYQILTTNPTAIKKQSTTTMKNKNDNINNALPKKQNQKVTIVYK